MMRDVADKLREAWNELGHASIHMMRNHKSRAGGLTEQQRQDAYASVRAATKAIADARGMIALAERMEKADG